MDNSSVSRSDRMGLRWRWLFLLGGAIYAINGISSIFVQRDVYRFMGTEMSQVPYVVLQIGLGVFLLSLYIKFRRKMKALLKDQVLNSTDPEEDQG